MSKLRRLVLIRHGETDGRSSERFHGSGDVALSSEGCSQMREAARGLAREVFDLVVASPLRRSWEAAWIVSGGARVRLETDFREIDFGRWEGLTREEIEASDPVLYREWQDGGAGFEFPGGEPRGEFRARVLRALERLEAGGAISALVVAHKGVIRAIAEKLLGRPLEAGEPAIAGRVSLTRAPDGRWYEGRQGSDPEVLARAS
jgi:probable phosphoglycerate mutase